MEDNINGGQWRDNEVLEFQKNVGEYVFTGKIRWLYHNRSVLESVLK